MSGPLPVATHSKALEQRMRRDEKARLDSIAELQRELKRETDPDEKANIQRTLKELRDNKPLELPVHARQLRLMRAGIAEKIQRYCTNSPA